MADYWRDYQQGEVRALRPGQDPPISSLVAAFQGQDVNPADAIVLSGFLGRSDILKRVRDYLERAKRIAEAKASGAALSGLAAGLAEPNAALNKIRAKADQEHRAEGAAAVRAEALDAGVSDATTDELVTYHLETAPQATVDEIAEWLVDNAALDAEGARDLAARLTEERAARLAASNIAGIDGLLAGLERVKETAEPHIPWRLYLTPSLDTWVDFHRSSLLAFRREARSERQDACTVWLKAFEEGRRDPIPYRVVHQSVLGPSFATYLGGEVLDDYLGQSSSGGAWGDQVYGGGKPGTGITCGGKPWSGVRCAG